MLPRYAGILMIVVAFGGRAFGQDPNTPPPPPTPGDANEQVLTQGPVHEAFAGPVVYDPKPGPVIAKPPPDAIPEMPPNQKPEGANVQWISGYWAWDDHRNDYLWISGVWRNVPPGRQWVPGYWHEAQGGVQWAPGVWMAAQSSGQQYLAAPPASIEAGPNSPSPTPNSTWSPGNWVWQDSRYYWRPGFWIAPQPNWVWVPSQYVWTPSGYLFAEGYWDRPIATRGQMFAPVYYAQPVYLQPNYVYQPTIGIVAGGLMVSLFVRPSYHAYYFGDYYAPSYVGIGIYPWYSYHQSAFGYDPLFSYYSVTYRTSNPGWVASIHQEYIYRQNNIAARPPHTYFEMTRITQTNVTVNNVRNISFAAPINRIAASNGSAMRFQRIEAAEQRQHMEQAKQLQTFRDERARSEAVAVRNREPGAPIRPRAMELPKSPIAHNAAAAAHVAATEKEGVASHHTPPAHPVHPELDHKAEPLAAAHPNVRPEPRFDPHPAATPGRSPAPGQTEARRPVEREAKAERKK